MIREIKETTIKHECYNGFEYTSETTITRYVDDPNYNPPCSIEDGDELLKLLETL